MNSGVSIVSRSIVSRALWAGLVETRKSLTVDEMTNVWQKFLHQ